MKLDRSSLLKLFLLDVVADDYEDFEHIESTVRRMAERCGMTIRGEETIESLEKLIREGWIQAYWLSERQPAERIEGVPSREEIHDAYCYFMITAEGAVAQAEDVPEWPFDGWFQLKPGWAPPER